MLNIILTSYNRPNLIRRTIESLKAQTRGDWFCTVLDDNSTGATLEAIYAAIGDDPHFEVIEHATTDEQRANTTRYACLINEILPTLDGGIVGFLCDNVEYHPDLVGDVLDYFEHHPDVFGGYVLHLRDVWKRDGLDGSTYLGNATQYGHWDVTPPSLGVFDGNVRGYFDHSQVFHRLPCALRWNEDTAVKTYGDGDYFNRLVETHGPLYPINNDAIRTMEHLLK